MSRVTILLGEEHMFDRLDTVASPEVDLVFLRRLPRYSEKGNSLINSIVEILNNDGDEVPEVLGGEIMSASSVGSFAYGHDRVIRLAFPKGEFANAQEARNEVANYSIRFKLEDNASYIQNHYEIEFWNRDSGVKTFNSIVVGDEQLLQLMKSKISTADLGKMSPFRIVIYPEIRAR